MDGDDLIDIDGRRRDAHDVNPQAPSAVHPEPLGRYVALDDQGKALRATWRPAHGFVNLSLWRDDTCIETFHLTTKDASGFVAFLVSAFAAAVPPATRTQLAAVQSSAPRAAQASRRRGSGVVRRIRQGLSAELEQASRRLRP